MCGAFLFGHTSSSEAKDANTKDTLDKMTVALANSTPNVVSTPTLNLLGSFETPPLNPKENDCYYNSKSLQNFIWNGFEWILKQNK